MTIYTVTVDNGCQFGDYTERLVAIVVNLNAAMWKALNKLAPEDPGESFWKNAFIEEWKLDDNNNFEETGNTWHFAVDYRWNYISPPDEAALSYGIWTWRSEK